MRIKTCSLAEFVVIGIAVTSLVALGGCSSLKTPATADVAVSAAAVDNANVAGGDAFAPVEMQSARAKLALAHKAMRDKDYQQASDLAMQAQADAKLAQSKANTAKAQEAANALQVDIGVLREELNRANINNANSSSTNK